MNGAQEVPAVTTTATGGLQVILSADSTKINCRGSYTVLTPTAAHIHKAAVGATGGVVITLTAAGGTITRPANTAVTAAQVTDLQGGLWYGNVHTAANGGGEIRGQLVQP
jgi:hypothetical protein